MSDELARLRAKLEILNECNHWVFTKDAIESAREKIARLEAEADPWRVAKQFASAYREPSESSNLQKLIAHYDHLTAENERLTARVAELEAFQAKWCDSFDLTDSDRKRMAALIQVGLQASPDDPILDPARVLATAAEVLRYKWRPDAIEWLIESGSEDAKPYRLKGDENGS